MTSFIFEDIADHIKRPLDARMAHVDLSSPCFVIGTGSRECRGLLAYFLATTVPRRREALLCHACAEAACSNPRHLYWGTASENLKDAYAAGVRMPAGFALFDRERLLAASSKGGKAGKSKPKKRESWPKKESPRRRGGRRNPVKILRISTSSGTTKATSEG